MVRVVIESFKNTADRVGWLGHRIPPEEAAHYDSISAAGAGGASRKSGVCRISARSCRKNALFSAVIPRHVRGGYGTPPPHTSNRRPSSATARSGIRLSGARLWQPILDVASLRPVVERK